MSNHSYFSLPEFFKKKTWMDRKRHPYQAITTSKYSGHSLELYMTKSAIAHLASCSEALLAEMQLYFSCVVKKRVVIHQSDDQDTYTRVFDNLWVRFKCVQADSCSPEEFANHYPEKKQLITLATKKFHARNLYLDYKQEQWLAHFNI